MDAYASAAPDVVGNRDGTIAGHVPVDTPGTRLTQVVSVRNVEKPGSKLNVSSANNGHDMTTGMSGKKVKERNSALGENGFMIGPTSSEKPRTTKPKPTEQNIRSYARPDASRPRSVPAH